MTPIAEAWAEVRSEAPYPGTRQPPASRVRRSQRGADGPIEGRALRLGLEDPIDVGDVIDAGASESLGWS